MLFIINQYFRKGSDKLKLGVDVGFSSTKWVSGGDTNSQGVFYSTVREGKPLPTDSNFIHITYMGKDFVIGATNDVNFTMDINKIHDNCFRLPLFTAIAQAMKGTKEDVQLVTGLPPGFYNSMKDELRNSLVGVNVEMTINNVRKEFAIRDVIVYLQCAGYFLLEPKLFERDGAEILVGDFGGKSFDVCQYLVTDGRIRPQKFESYVEFGMNQMYSDLASYFRSITGEKFSFYDAERFVRLGDLYLDDLPQGQTEKINEVLKSYADKSIAAVKTDFPFLRCKKAWMGGGAITLKKFLPGGDNISPSTIMDNARIFYKVAAEKFA